jgi:hypothetical protein
MDQENNTCSDCGSVKGKLFRFNCPHKFCVECTLIYAYARLSAFYQALETNVDYFNNKASFLGCKHLCDQAKLSLSLRYLLKFVDSSQALSPQQKTEFKKFSEVGISFFSGLKSCFSRCKICNQICSNLNEKLLICRACITNQCLEYGLPAPKGIYFEWQCEESEYIEKESMFKSFFLVQSEENSYKGAAIVGNQLKIRIFKPTELQDQTKLIIMRAVVEDHENRREYFDMVDNEVLQQIIAIVVLIR